MSVRGLLLLLPASVTIVTSVTRCDPDKYKLKSLDLCCHLCEAGQYVTKDCDKTHRTQCHECASGTFMAHPNREASCLPCTQCREDQEEVTSCHPTRDRQCQCMPGTHYCDSVDCMEQCYPCTRCNGATLHACNATRDAICAAERNPVPGNANTDSSISVPVWVPILLVIVSVTVNIYCCRRQCAQLSQQVVNFLKEKSSKPSSHSRSFSLPNEILPPMDTERLPPAIGVNTPLLDEGSSSAPGAGTPPLTFEDPEDGTELRVLVDGGSDTAPAPAPAPALQAQAPTACGLQPRAEASAPLSGLQQEYEHKYYLKDTSCNGTNRIYYEFGRQVPERKWKMLMRFVGLEDKDIEICEHENAGNLVEQHHEVEKQAGTGGLCV